jgi:hypothetical protein
VSEELEEQPLVDNPELIELKREKSSLVSQLHGFELELADKIRKEVKDDMVWKDIKKKEIKLFSDIVGKESEITLTRILHLKKKNCLEKRPFLVYNIVKMRREKEAPNG